MAGILPLIVFVFAESANVLAIAAASVNGKPVYNSAAIVLVVETLKLGVAYSSLRRSPRDMEAFRAHGVGMWLRCAVPGLLYCVNNNIFLEVLSQVPPAAFQVLLQLRVVWTGVLFRVWLGRSLTRGQWLSLVALCCGTLLAQSAKEDPDQASEAASRGEYVATMTAAGFMLSILYTVISSLAGVYNELLLKSKGDVSMHVTNVPLYSWGVGFNLLTLLMQGNASTEEGGLWRGWDHPSTAVIACLMAANGLLISAVVKRFDNIVKIICVVASNGVVYICSVMWMGVPFRLVFVVGATLVGVATYGYATAGAAPGLNKEGGGGAASDKSGKGGDDEAAAASGAELRSLKAGEGEEDDSGPLRV